MPGAPACPGCGRELAGADVCPCCSWADSRARFLNSRPSTVASPAQPLPLLEPEPLPEPLPEPAAPVRVARKKPPARPAARQAGGKTRSTPKPPPKPPAPLEASELIRSWVRATSTRQLASESRFLEQRNQAAHRHFLGILDRVCPLTLPEEWPEFGSPRAQALELKGRCAPFYR
jgi:hypothetical protein